MGLSGMPGRRYLWKSGCLCVWSISKSPCQHCCCPASTAGSECSCGCLSQSLVLATLCLWFLVFPFLLFLIQLRRHPLLWFKFSCCFVDAVFLVGWSGMCYAFCVASLEYRVLNAPSRLGEVLVWALQLGCCVRVSIGQEWWKLYESREKEGLSCAPAIEEISVASQDGLDLLVGESKGWWSHPQ